MPYAALGEQFVVVTATERTDTLLSRDGRVELGQSTVVPAADSLSVDLGAHRGDPAGRHRAELDVQLLDLRPEQLTQRDDGRAGPVEVDLEPFEVAGNHRGAPGRIRGGEDGLDLGQRYVELTEPMDHLGRGDLGGFVVPVAGEGVDVGGVEQTRLVIAAQRPNAQLRQRRELPDRQSCLHTGTFHSPLGECQAR